MTLKSKCTWKRFSASLTVGLAGALALSACTGGGGSGAGDSGEQVLTFALSEDPPQPMTGMQQGTAMQQLNAMVHRGLMEFDSDGSVVEGLAETVDQPDDSTYVFTLRDGLNFSDGSPLTAENVKNSLDYYRDSENGAFLA